jgi:hypothetical protein
MKPDDFLYSETDDTCAICGIRGKQILTIHHIDGHRSNDAYDNLIVICHNCEHLYHDKKELSRQQIEDRKRHLILKTITQYGLNAMNIASRNDFGIVGMPFPLYHLMDLGYMTQAETQMGYRKVHVTVRFTITDSGKALLRKWFS